MYAEFYNLSLLLHEVYGPSIMKITGKVERIVYSIATLRSFFIFALHTSVSLCP